MDGRHWCFCFFCFGICLAIAVHSVVNEIDSERHTFLASPAIGYELPKQVFFFTNGSREIDTFNTTWSLRQYNRTLARAYILENCTKVLSAYDLAKPLVEKANFFKMCALYNEGGLYIDDDLFSLYEFDKVTLTSNEGLLLVKDRPLQRFWKQLDARVWGSLIGSAWRYHPYFDCGMSIGLTKAFHNHHRGVHLPTTTDAFAVCARNYKFRYEVAGSWPYNYAKNMTHIVAIRRTFPTYRPKALAQN